MSRPPPITRLLREYGLTRMTAKGLTLRRLRRGKSFHFVDESGRPIREVETLTRLRALAMPPAYNNVRYAADPTAHLQAVGEDAAGRLQYRYHPSWLEVRERLKAQRLGDLAKSLPAVHGAVRRALGNRDDNATLAVAAVIRLVSKTALRAGSDSYARERGTRGATTLLKSNVQISGPTVHLHFRGKGAKEITTEMKDRVLANAMLTLLAIPGRRLFQYRAPDGTIRKVRASNVNAYLRKVAGRAISLKDFRTMVASAGVLDALALAPATTSKAARKAQLREAIADAAEQLANTPTVCRRSYVHDAVIAAFEHGRLPRYAGRSAEHQTLALARIVTGRR